MSLPSSIALPGVISVDADLAGSVLHVDGIQHVVIGAARGDWGLANNGTAYVDTLGQAGSESALLACDPSSGNVVLVRGETF